MGELGPKGTWAPRNQIVAKGTSSNLRKAKQQYTRNCLLMTTMQEDPNNNTKRPKQQCKRSQTTMTQEDNLNNNAKKSSNWKNLNLQSQKALTF